MQQHKAHEVRVLRVYYPEVLNGGLMYYFIVNYRGGNGRGQKVWKDVRSILEAESVPYHAWRTRGRGHAARLATEIIRRYSSKDVHVNLIVLGGDGTVNEVINGISDFDRVWLGVIPTGSGNDFVRGLGLPTKPVPALMQILNCEKPTRVDLGWVKGDNQAPRMFGISAGIGLDAEVCKKALKSRQKRFLNKLGAGKLTYILLTIESLFTMKTRDGRVIYDGNLEDVLRVRKMIFLAGMNLRWEGGGVPMAPDADPFDGKISTCVAENIPKWKTFFELPILVMGKQKKLKGFTLKEGATLDIEMEEPVVLHVDGEYGGDVRRIHVEVLPGRLQLLMNGACCNC